MIDENKLIEELQDFRLPAEGLPPLIKAAVDITCRIQFEKLINKQPKVGEWVRCEKDNLPEKAVLCCDTHGDQVIGYVCIDTSSKTGFNATEDDCYMYDVIAWKPLPKPYECEV